MNGKDTMNHISEERKKTSSSNPSIPNSSEAWIDRMNNIESEQSELWHNVFNLIQITKSQTERIEQLEDKFQKIDHSVKNPITYRGVFSLLAVVAILGITAIWLLLQFAQPSILNQINGRVNNNEIRLQRVEKQLDGGQQKPILNRINGRVNNNEIRLQRVEKQLGVGQQKPILKPNAN